MQELTLELLYSCSQNTEKIIRFLKTERPVPHVHSIEKAYKTLAQLSDVFSVELQIEAKKWLERQNAVGVLKNLLLYSQSLNQQLGDIKTARKENQEKVSLLREGISPAVQEEAVEVYKKGQVFFDKGYPTAEKAVINKYNRLQSLEKLIPFVENIDNTCQLIEASENRQELENELHTFEKRIETQEERLKSIKMGFIVSIVISFLIITLPLSLAFAITLSNRKNATERDIANTKERIRKLNRNLEWADEGFLISKEIRANLGDDVTVEQIRRTLNEVKDLRQDFHRKEQFNSLTAEVLVRFNRLHTKNPQFFERLKLDGLDIVKQLKIFCRKVKETLEAEETLLSLESEQIRLERLKQEAMKGYTTQIIESSLKKLEANDSPFDGLKIIEDMKIEFVRMCQNYPEILSEIKTLLEEICSKGRSLSEKSVETLKPRLESVLQTLDFMRLDNQLAHISNQGDSPALHNTERIKKNA